MTNNIQVSDFNVFLHELRTRELKKIPPGAKKFLSGGCAGNWYFDWLNNNYPGIEKHIGIEAYQQKPVDLPHNVLWIENTLSNMDGVNSSEADLVFAGQTVEHLWPDELAGFLCESNRVLKKNGLIVLDSPNRRITHGLHWYQPEHTIELNVEEIVSLLTMAGFADIVVRGIWLCYDYRKHMFLPLEPTSNAEGWNYEERILEAAARPEDSFCWWVEARKNSSPNKERLRSRITEIFEEVWPLRISRVYHQIGQLDNKNNRMVIQCTKGESGALIHGPYTALRPGKYRAFFELGYKDKQISKKEIIGMLDVYTSYGNKFIAKKEIKVLDLELDKLKNIFIEFETTKVEFGIEFRLWSNGKIPLTASFKIRLENLNTSF